MAKLTTTFESHGISGGQFERNDEMIYEIEQTQDTWITIEHTTALSVGKGSNKRLIVRTRFDGNGNSIVRFVVLDHGHEETYEKFDAAVYNFNKAK